MHVVRMMEASQASTPRRSSASSRKKDRFHHHHHKSSTTMSFSNTNGHHMRSASGPSSQHRRQDHPAALSRTNHKGSSSRNVAMLEQERLEEEDRIAMSVMNNLYRHARSCRWNGVERDLQLLPEQTKYVHLDGTTTLHLAVMSRTGYVLDPPRTPSSSSSTTSSRSSSSHAPCPLGLLELICRLHPAAALQPCHINSYTPLAYACLVASGSGAASSAAESSSDESSDENDDDDSSERQRRRRERRKRPTYRLEDAQEIVRILLKYCPECTKVFTAGGLSALDVHIVSYSQRRNSKSIGRRRQRHRKGGGRHSSCASTDERSLASSPAINQDDHHPLTGRTNTLVLRTLLEADPTLAHVRISKDRVTGPVELLYRCNSADFLKVVSQEGMKQNNNNNNSSTLSSKRQQQQSLEKNQETSLSSKQIFMKNMSHWWVWRWTILILKYGTVPSKKRGAKFSCLQAAAGLVGCPLPILTLAMNAFPKQVREIDQMHGQGLGGNVPLHEVCSWPCEEDVASTDPVIPSRKGMAIAALLGEYPEAAKLKNASGQTPLELAVESGTTWDSGVRKLVRAHPQAVSKKSVTLVNFTPFLCAAVAAGESLKRQGPLPNSKRSLMTHLKNVAKQDLQFVRTIYGLLRANPIVLITMVEENKDTTTTTSSPTGQPKSNDNKTSLWTTFPEDSDLWASMQLQDESNGSDSQWTDFGDSGVNFPSPSSIMSPSSKR